MRWWLLYRDETEADKGVAHGIEVEDWLSEELSVEDSFEELSEGPSVVEGESVSEGLVVKEDSVSEGLVVKEDSVSVEEELSVEELSLILEEDATHSLNVGWYLLKILHPLLRGSRQT